MSEAVDDLSHATAPPVRDEASIHPWWLRVVHWANATAIVLLILSGWRIYDATHFMFNKTLVIPPKWTIGGWLGGAIQWHFAAMWILFATSLTYLVMSFVTHRMKRQFLPLTLPGLIADIGDFLKGHLSHADIRKYNTIQKLAYLFAMADIVVLILSGLVLFKSVQLGGLRLLLGGYETARVIHFTAMALMVVFIVVHVVMALLVPRTIKAMLWGR